MNIYIYIYIVRYEKKLVLVCTIVLVQEIITQHCQQHWNDDDDDDNDDDNG